MAINDQIMALNIKALRAPKDTREQFKKDEHADRELVAYTTKAMRIKLASASEKGRAGWWDDKQCTAEQLHSLMLTAVQEDDLISVINYAAMVHARKLADQQE